jgi:hypothetical protein
MKGNSEFVKQYARSEFWKGFRNVMIGGLILTVIWIVLGHFVPLGWPITTVNIICLLLSLGFAWTLIIILRQVLPWWLSAILSALAWVLLFGLIRGLF